MSAGAENGWLERASTAVDERLGRLEAPLWATLALAALAFGGHVAALRPLWFDEIFSRYISDFDSIGAFWRSLSSSGDFNPPLHYLAVAATRTAGAGEDLAVRMPSVVALLGAMAATYALVSRLTRSAAYGWIAALFVARQVRYGIEGRPYALTLCFLALLLLLWWRRTRGLGGSVELAAIGLVTALGISTHFYFGLALCPLFAAELYRWHRRQRPDVPVALALAAGLVPLVAYLPIVAYFREFSTENYWSMFHPSRVGATYDLLAAGGGLGWQPLALLLAIRWLRPAWLPSGAGAGSGTNAGERRISGEVWCVMIGLAALPLLGALGAAVTRGHFTPRHYLPACLGLAGLASLFAWKLARGSRAVGLILAFGMALPVAGALSTELTAARSKRAAIDEQVAWLRAAAGGKPVLMCEPLEALQLAEHAAAAGGKELVVFCRADKPMDSPDRSLLALRGRPRLRMLSLDRCFEAFSDHLVLDRAEGRSDCFRRRDWGAEHRVVATPRRHRDLRLYRLEVLDPGEIIFADGFESGSLDGWE